MLFVYEVWGEARRKESVITVGLLGPIFGPGIW